MAGLHLVPRSGVTRYTVSRANAHRDRKRERVVSTGLSRLGRYLVYLITDLDFTMLAGVGEEAYYTAMRDDDSIGRSKSEVCQSFTCTSAPIPDLC